jgi:hypothetical protein
MGGGQGAERRPLDLSGGDKYIHYHVIFLSLAPS